MKLRDSKSTSDVTGPTGLFRKQQDAGLAIQRSAKRESAIVKREPLLH